MGLRRLGYRGAYRGLQVLWFFWRPRKQGVKCLVTAEDRVLLVRHTYGRRSWDIPGGAVKRGEPPHVTARREMDEELGLGSADWVKFGEIEGRIDHRRDKIHCFRADLDATPQLTLDRGELDVARWFDRAQLPADLSPYVVPIMRGAFVHDQHRHA